MGHTVISYKKATPPPVTTAPTFVLWDKLETWLYHYRKPIIKSPEKVHHGNSGKHEFIRLKCLEEVCYLSYGYQRICIPTSQTNKVSLPSQGILTSYKLVVHKLLFRWIYNLSTFPSLNEVESSLCIASSMWMCEKTYLLPLHSTTLTFKILPSATQFALQK